MELFIPNGLHECQLPPLPFFVSLFLLWLQHCSTARRQHQITAAPHDRKTAAPNCW